MDYTDRIKPSDKSIVTYLEELKNNIYQIPTFQRDVVWQEANVKKLWDSIYKYYPLGSILVWKTDVKLHNHRQVGGHLLMDENFDRKDFQYLLDGQQRTTSLLTSLYGGKIEGRDNFDPTLYIDLTIENNSDTDDESYKERFLYWSEINDKNGSFTINSKKQKKYDEGLIVKLADIKDNFNKIQEKIVKHPEVNADYNHQYWVELRNIQHVLINYRLAFIELKGIQVSEVCQIFERINQAGKPLDIFDIVVAKTYRPKTQNDNGFYLREIIDNFKNNVKNHSKFLEISDFDYLQIIATIIKESMPESGINNITPRYLNDLKSEQIEKVWNDTKIAILKTFDFFENTLNIKSPQLIPYRYFYLTIANYFYKNENPNYNFLKQYFWYISFHNTDLLSNTGDINKHISLLKDNKEQNQINFERFLIDKDTLRKASYSSKGRISRAILSLYAHKMPKDWKYTDRMVNADNQFFSTDKPNLHHIFPTNYIADNKGANLLDNNSLMNIAYLTQLTNLKISDRNPLEYIQEFAKNPDFIQVLESHLIPKDIITWAYDQAMPDNALDIFIEKRADLIIEELKSQLKDVRFDTIDSKSKL